MREFESDIWRAQERIELFAKGIQALNQKIEQCRQKVGRADIARRRLATTESIARLLRAILDTETTRFVRILNEEIGRTFGRIVFKDYWAEVSSNFDLSIRKRVGDTVMEVPKGTGENQITAFSFIGSLVSLAKRLGDEAPILKGVQGGEFPLVMDSPVRSLG